MFKRGAGGFLRGALCGYGTFIVSGIMIVAVTAVCLLDAEDPGSMIRPLSAAALYVSVCVGGFVSSRISGEGTLCGVTVGAAAFLTVLLAGILPLYPIWSGTNKTVLYLAVIVAGAAGGFVGKRRKKKRVGHKRRRTPM